jgi:hypothetical protein
LIDNRDKNVRGLKAMNARKLNRIMIDLVLFFYTVIVLTGCGSNSTSGADSTQMGGAIQGKVLKLKADTSTLAGSPGLFASTDGIGSVARFDWPNGITSEGTNLYITDYVNSTIRKMAIATGEVTTLAGSAGLSGLSDGTGSSARFYLPWGITTDGTNLYVADTGNNAIRKVVIATGVVTTLAGNVGLSNNPWGITTDGINLYVAISGSNMIYKVVIATGKVSVLAGNGASGSTDGSGSTALFHSPSAITTDGTNLYIADSNNHIIRKMVIATGEVTTLAGGPGLSGSTDGIGSSARFNWPGGITTDGTNLYVVDSNNSIIRQVAIATGVVTTLAGSAGLDGSIDGSGAVARFNGPLGITTDGAKLYIADTLNFTIRSIQ